MQELGAYFQGKRVLVTGGAGFVGSFLVERLVELGSKVIVVDNLSTGSKDNLKALLESDAVEFIEADAALPVADYFEGTVEALFHLASPASPVDFEKMPVAIYQINAWGTHHLAKYCAKQGTRLLFASTSEVYGEPEVHPQTEAYRGNVSTSGPRACYDESKRFGEMVLSVFNRTHHLDTRTVRIFNTYGPRMQAGDGRVIPNLIRQALAGEPLTIYGEGTQTRSFCYVSDMVEYLLLVMAHEEARGQIYNVGNTEELTINAVAQKIQQLTNSQSDFRNLPLPQDDPSQRKPDISKVVALTGYEPQVSFETGLERTIAHFRAQG